MNLVCPIDPTPPPISAPDAGPHPQDSRPPAEAEADRPTDDGIASEMQVCTSGTLVAIVRRQDGQTVEVIRVVGDD
ncbi:hypothetical protein [Tautonia plasticadhaerens]|uniref:Uncharacterized protein n=1 Tax=Tautonia plasticadhaerens TaxID=2527974 RepID=A0A518H505_9BACT|nr:hypothetical protein [Tautonia plasticadhaerens]QDV35926.1 hypothetical protein ElP_38350 [Tautonia plasticadhaerens]